MRDAELRFETLRLRIEDRVVGSRGEQVTMIDATIRHPGWARVTTSQPGQGLVGNYDVWISDGETVRTYSAQHHVGTRRPVRRAPVGLDSPDLPGRSAVYAPLTPLPMQTLPETFVHPAGFCQNVLTTGECRVTGAETVAGREAILVQCDHPRATQVSADRADHRLVVAVDRATGIITRLLETVAGAVTRDAEVVNLETDRPLAPGAFDFEFPAATTTIY